MAGSSAGRMSSRLVSQFSTTSGLGMVSTQQHPWRSARHSSPDSMSTDSDNESDVRPGHGSQQLQQLLLPHLVIRFSYNKHKKQKRFSSPDSEDLLVASRRKISISDTAAGSSQVTGSLPSPSSYPTSPSSKPLSPMGSLASVPEQVALSSCLHVFTTSACPSGSMMTGM